MRGLSHRSNFEIFLAKFFMIFQMAHVIKNTNLGPTLMIKPDLTRFEPQFLPNLRPYFDFYYRKYIPIWKKIAKEYNSKSSVLKYIKDADSREEVDGNDLVAFKSVFKKQDARQVDANDMLSKKNQHFTKKLVKTILLSDPPALDSDDYDYIWLGDAGPGENIFLRNCPGKYFPMKENR